MVQSNWYENQVPCLYWDASLGHYYPSDPPTSSSTVVDRYSDDKIISNGNVYYYSLRDTKKWSATGEFYVVKRTYRETSTLGVGAHHFQRNDLKTYPARVRWAAIYPQRAKYANVSNGNFPTASPSSDSTLRALGRQAINRVAPTQSHSDLATSIGEIAKDGLPSMVGMASNGKRVGSRAFGAGDEYLNYQFGVAPLVSDVTKAVDAYRRSSQIWDEYVRNSGKLLKRRYDFPIELTVQRAVETSVPPVPNIHQNFKTGFTWPINRTITTEIRRWFVGTFQYHIPENPFLRNLARWEKLYGVLPDINTVWELTPWSWAADWVGDFGTLASNMTAFSKDGLVLRHGYVMEHKTVTHLYEMTGVGYHSFPGKHTFTQSLKTETKRRIVASPYGFDVDWPDFSGRQMAILASLGITKGNKIR